jgi:Nucleotidyl transferase AbiEii toxin, Type IV TA system
MQALAYWKSVAMDETNFLEALTTLFHEHKIQYCVIGGQGVNAYADPLVSLDLDLVVALDQLPQVETLLVRQYKVETFPHSVNVSAEGSQVRVQLQTDPRYRDFPARAETREVLGLRMPVARIEDVLDGKVWAALSPDRRSTKRRKDLLDIERLLEAHPTLRARVPPEILQRLDSFQ